MAKQLVNIGTSINKGDGDPLRTAFDKINQNFNIFSKPHQLLVNLVRPLSYFFAHKCSNAVNLGNAFNNLAMHCVTAGQSRTSYVLRLVKSDCVFTSKECVRRAIEVSDNCKPFAIILDHIRSDDTIRASAIDWQEIVKQ